MKQEVVVLTVLLGIQESEKKSLAETENEETEALLRIAKFWEYLSTPDSPTM